MGRKERHRHWHEMRHGMRHFYGVHLHRRLFWWFGASIFITGVVFVAMARWHAHHHMGPPRALFLFGIAALVLWAVSGKVARRIAQPIYDLVRVSRERGDGKLSSRAALACGEID